MTKKKAMPQARGMADLFQHVAAELYSAEQDQDQQNDEDRSDQAGRTITPTGAVRPGRDDT
jgi:hypothetical protein